MPPPRGCILVQRRGVCCAYVTCSKYHKLNEIAQRRGDGHNTISRRRMPGGGNRDGGGMNALFRGIEDDGMTHEVEGNEMRKFRHAVFSRMTLASAHIFFQHDALPVCVVNGTIYKSGSAMTSSSLCSYCYCIAGHQKCVQPKCLLASPGCEPIYSDSTCCPIRYDCTKKKLTAAVADNGSVNSERAIDELPPRSKPNTVHHSNKHYLRTKMRKQRSRGCIIGPHFYPEGLKLPGDPLSPCNVCFCIRGAQKCTPKKCAPSIENCEPIMVPGQCCPASYACDHSSERALPNKSRQFDFYSMFFGDELENGTTALSPPGEELVANSATTLPVKNSKPNSSPSMNESSTASASDTIFAAIEAGLKYIDNNDDKVVSLLDGSVQNGTQPTRSNIAVPTPRPNVQLSSTTTEKELSFLDIFLGDDDDDEASAAYLKPKPIEDTTIVITTYSTDHSTPKTTITKTVSTSIPIDYTPSTFDSSSSTTLTYSDATTDSSTTYWADPFDSTTYKYGITDTTEDVFKSTIVPANQESTVVTNESTEASTNHETPTTTITVTPIPSISFTEKSEPIRNQSVAKNDSTTQSTSTISTTTPKIIRPEPAGHTATAAKPSTTTENIFSAFIDGIQNMLNEKNGTAAGLNKLYKIRVNTDRNATHRTPQQSTSALPHRVRNMTSISPAPSQANHAKKPQPTPIPLSSVSISYSSSNDAGNSNSVSASKTTQTPLVISSNPSILESELNYDYGEPTLPPSLPNLKIIPFLPTDAVKTNRNHLSNYGFYNTLPPAAAKPPSQETVDKFDDSYSFPGESQPVLSLDQLALSKENKHSNENKQSDGNEFELFHVGAQMSGDIVPADKLFHQQLHNMQQSYPAITESIYELNAATHLDDEQNKQIYPPPFTKLGPTAAGSFPFAAQTERTTGSGERIVTGYQPYVTAYPERLAVFDSIRNNQFSPPIKTEGCWSRSGYMMRIVFLIHISYFQEDFYRRSI